MATDQIAPIRQGSPPGAQQAARSPPAAQESPSYLNLFLLKTFGAVFPLKPSCCGSLGCYLENLPKKLTGGHSSGAAIATQALFPISPAKILAPQQFLGWEGRGRPAKLGLLW